MIDQRQAHIVRMGDAAHLREHLVDHVLVITAGQQQAIDLVERTPGLGLRLDDVDARHDGDFHPALVLAKRFTREIQGLPCDFELADGTDQVEISAAHGPLSRNQLLAE